MSDEVIILVLKLVHGQSQVAVMKQHEQGLGVRDQHVASDVELTFLDTQRIRNVLLDDATERFAHTETPLLAVVVQLELLLEGHGIAHKIDSLALVE
jgi:hypothetical protein